MKITAITIYKQQPQRYQTNPLDTLSFEARVDKGMDRFYGTNETRMPQTVKDYVATLDDKTKLTPLETQQKAFELLEVAENAEDIKGAYPDEELFKTLIDPEQSKARRGIVKIYNDFAQDLHAENKDILKSKENFTVYLVKKVFLENKTIAEINQDLETDLEPDFKALLSEQEEYVHSSTLSTLGIKAPSSEYRQSLRYTKDGYSDFVGEKISEAQRAFWENMPEEERTARARKSVASFENWWENLSNKQRLDLIAAQESELEMLKMFKEHQKAEKGKPSKPASEAPKTPRPHTKVGSSKLSQDELFIRWASNNLKKYNESMTDAEKEAVHTRRVQLLTSRWKEMSSAERTDYISRMKSGTEPLRYAMIDAWNNSIDVIKALSSHLRENHILKPADLLYSTEEFSQFQSEVMTDFWQKYPDFTVQLGERIQMANEKVNASIANGTFIELKRQIINSKNKRIKELETFKKALPIQPQTTQTPDYMQDFKQTYLSLPQTSAQLKNMPQTYIEDYFNAIKEGYSQKHIEAWTKNLKGQPISNKEVELLREILDSEPVAAIRMNRAIEAALANVLYECTNNSDVFRFSHSDCKIAIAQIARGEKEIHIVSQKENQEFQMPLIKRRLDKAKIANLYHSYKQELSADEIHRIAHSFFVSQDTGTSNALEEYISGYGRSANIIFSDKSVFPNSVKERFYQKFMNNMPEEISENSICLFDRFSDPFGREAKIKKVNFLLSKRFDFVPTDLMEKYQDEVGRSFRLNASPSFEEFETRVCRKRANLTTNSGLALLNKSGFTLGNSLRMLAGEQVLAEALYESTKNPAVFAMQFEELCDNIELFNMIKKFPSESRTYYSTSLGEEITLTANSKLNLKNLKDEYLACTNDVTDLWLNTEVKNSGIGRLKSLVEILANGEPNPKILEAMIKRIKMYKLRLLY